MSGWPLSKRKEGSTENLFQLSFDQEEVLKGFKKTSNVDPQYVTLSQKQLKVKTDSKVISDSLLALSRRVFEIKSFVTRELSSMNAKIEESIDAIKARRQDQTLTKQQFAMSSMNNLALMLDDVLNQMQNQMAESKKAGSKSASGLSRECFSFFLPEWITHLGIAIEAIKDTKAKPIKGMVSG